MKCPNPNCNTTDHEPDAKFCHKCVSRFGKDKEELSSVGIFNVKGVEFKKIQVKGGSFMMGAHKIIEDVFEHESQCHPVSLGTFGIGETEVTQELWKVVMGNNPSTYK